jgi:hypothetical protein
MTALVASPLLAWHEMTCASPYLEQFGEPLTPQALAEHRCLLNSHYSGREEWLYHQQHELLRVRVRAVRQQPLQPAEESRPGRRRYRTVAVVLLQTELADGRLRWLLRDFQTRACRCIWCTRIRVGCPSARRCWRII